MYSGLFGLRMGSWQSLEGFTDIAVLRKRITTTAFSRSTRSGTTSDDVVFDVCLMDSSHRSKQIVDRSSDEALSIQKAKHLAKTLGLNYGAYNPEISASTRAKK